MGYQREPTIYTIRYADHPGLVVRALGLSMGEFFDMGSLADLDIKNLNIEDLRRVFQPFADALQSWNLEYALDGPDRGEGPIYRKGDPVPVTLAGILSYDMEFVFELLTGWMDSVISVDAPLAQPSTDGSLSLVESLPMDVLSQSRVS